MKRNTIILENRISKDTGYGDFHIYTKDKFLRIFYSNFFLNTHTYFSDIKRSYLNITYFKNGLVSEIESVNIMGKPNNDYEFFSPDGKCSDYVPSLEFMRQPYYSSYSTEMRFSKTEYSTNDQYLERSTNETVV
jgi:hypothetical protein